MTDWTATVANITVTRLGCAVFLALVLIVAGGLLLASPGQAGPPPAPSAPPTVTVNAGGHRCVLVAVSPTAWVALACEQMP